jgi:hypothetical protein
MQPAFYSYPPVLKYLLDNDKSSEDTNFSHEMFLLSAINEQFKMTQHLIQNQYRLSE